MQTRKLKIAISATGAGLQRESFSFITAELPDAEAMRIYAALTKGALEAMRPLPRGRIVSKKGGR